VTYANRVRHRCRRVRPAHEEREADRGVADPCAREGGEEQRASLDERRHPERDRGGEQPERTEDRPRDRLAARGERGENRGEDRPHGEQAGERRAEREREERQLDELERDGEMAEGSRAALDGGRQRTR